jgi:hypothetical protein
MELRRSNSQPRALASVVELPHDCGAVVLFVAVVWSLRTELIRPPPKMTARSDRRRKKPLR